jgi:hypothetical protein
VTILHYEGTLRPAQYTPVLSGDLEAPGWAAVMAAKEPAAAGHEAQDLSEQSSGDSDFRELKGDITAMSHDLRADLDELVAQGGERPVFHSLGQRQGAQEVAEIIGGQNRPEGTPVSIQPSDTPWSDR